jgi:polar amino acid transport system substrate-binding protein
MKVKVRSARWLVCALAIALTFTVAACGGDDKSTPSGGGTAAASEGLTVKDIRDAGTLRVGTWLQYKPEMWKDEKSGEIKGFWVDLARKMGDDMGVKVEFIDSDWDGLIPGLQSGKWDIVLAQMAITSERTLAVVFAKPWEAVGLVAVVPADSECHDVDCLNQDGRTIADEVGSASQEIYKRMFPKAKELANKQHNDGFLQLGTDRADAFLTDNISAYLWLEEHPGSVRIVPEDGTFLQPFPAGPALPQGSDDLAKWVDVWLQDQINNGTYEQLYEKNINQPVSLEALAIARGGYPG